VTRYYVVLCHSAECRLEWPCQLIFTLKMLTKASITVYGYWSCRANVGSYCSSSSERSLRNLDVLLGQVRQLLSKLAIRPIRTVDKKRGLVAELPSNLKARQGTFRPA
jgi:hypothetical protein